MVQRMSKRLSRANGPAAKSAGASADDGDSTPRSKIRGRADSLESGSSRSWGSEGSGSASFNFASCSTQRQSHTDSSRILRDSMTEFLAAESRSLWEGQSPAALYSPTIRGRRGSSEIISSPPNSWTTGIKTRRSSSLGTSQTRCASSSSRLSSDLLKEQCPWNGVETRPIADASSLERAIQHSLIN